MPKSNAKAIYLSKIKEAAEAFEQRQVMINSPGGIQVGTSSAATNHYGIYIAGHGGSGSDELTTPFMSRVSPGRLEINNGWEGRPFCPVCGSTGRVRMDHYSTNVSEETRDCMACNGKAGTDGKTMA